MNRCDPLPESLPATKCSERDHRHFTVSFENELDFDNEAEMEFFWNIFMRFL